jgi:hypothetical protein
MRIRGSYYHTAAVICAGFSLMALVVSFVVWPDRARGGHRALSNTPSATTLAMAHYTPSLPPERGLLTPTKTASKLLIVVSPTQAVHASTNTEAESSSSVSLSYESNVGKIKRTPHGFLHHPTVIQNHLMGLPPFYDEDSTLITPCKRKPYTADLRFMLIRPNGTLLGNPPGNLKSSPIFYVWTFWNLAYPSVLLEAILDDLTPSPDCPMGHCVSRIIPGTDKLRLVHVSDFGDSNTWCDNITQHRVSRLWVQLGKTSRLRGEDLRTDELERLSHHVEKYIAERMKTTYPAMEIGAVVGSTIGLFLILPIVLWVGCTLLYAAFQGTTKLYSMAKQRCTNASKQCAAIGAMFKRDSGKIRRRSTGTAAIEGGQNEGAELKDIGNAPPSYADATSNQEWNADSGRMV